MKEEILKISEKLRNGEISDIEARKLLFALFGVIESFPQNIHEIAELKNKIYFDTVAEMDADTAGDAYEMGIDYAIHELCLNR